MVILDKMNKKKVTISVSSEDSSSDESNQIDVEINDENVARVPTNGTDSDAGSERSKLSDSGNKSTMNEGWADSVAKILGSSKPKNKKTLVLSRAKKYSENIKKEKEEKPEFEVIGDKKDEKIDLLDIKTNSSEPPLKKKKKEVTSIRVKPNILEKDRERILSKVATKGVVQLFNAVRNQQKNLDKQINRSDISESKKDKVMKNFDKRTFLDALMGTTKSVMVDAETKSLKDEIKNEDRPKWSALRDDFMMGAKMKDWDKEVTEE